MAYLYSNNYLFRAIKPEKESVSQFYKRKSQKPERIKWHLHEMEFPSSSDFKLQFPIYDLIMLLQIIKS